MKFKYAIFDMDGTLIDSMHIWQNVCENYIRMCGYEMNPGFIDKFYTLSPEEGAKLFISEYNLDKTPDEVRGEINKMVERQYMTETILKPGVKELLISLNERGIKCAVATLTEKEVASEILEHVGILKYFTLIRTSMESGKSKKYPNIYNDTVALLEGTVEESCVFEDSLVAIRTARKAGYFVFGLPDLSNEMHRGDVVKEASVYLDTLEGFPIDEYFI